MIAFNRGGWGWLVLGLVLLVPLLSFWKWWQGMNARRRDNQAKPVRSAFAGTAAPTPLPGLPPAPPASTPPASEPAAKIGKVGAAPAPKDNGILVAANVLADSGPGFDPKTQRDPTLSPADIKRLQEPRHTPRGPGRVEDRIEVNGIIKTPTSINAIVNGERVRKDDEVLGARIVRIIGNCVEFEYRRKSFKKCIQ